MKTKSDKLVVYLFSGMAIVAGLIMSFLTKDTTWLYMAGGGLLLAGVVKSI